MVMIEETQLTRTCPKCRRTICYKAEVFLLRADRENKLCGSCSRKGKPKSAAHCANISAARKNNPALLAQTLEAQKKAAEAIRGKPNWWRGKKRSAEQRRKQSEAMKGRPSLKRGVPLSEELKQKARTAFLGKKHSDVTKAKMSEAHRGRKYGPRSEETKRKISLVQKGKIIPEHVREKTSRTMKHLLATTDLLQRRMKNTRKNCKGGKRECPNKFEVKLSSVLDQLFPGEYKFVGDGVVMIGGLNPDFINTNGQKKIVELFGEVYHDPRCCRWEVPVRCTENGRKAAFAEYGFKTLVVWCRELGDAVALEQKLIEFHKRG